MKTLKINKVSTILLLFLLCLSEVGLLAQANSNLSIDAILDKLEQNQVFEGTIAKGSISVKDRYGTRTIDMQLQSKGSDYSLIEFTSTAERGQKTLRVKDKIYLYYPDAEQIVTLNKSMFQQSILDSDVSYEDIAGDDSIREKFIANLESVEIKNGQESYKIYLSAINDRKETYPYQRIWVRSDTFTLHAAELFTRRKKLRKTLEVQAIQKVSKNRYFISKLVFSDVLKKNSTTTILMSEVEIRDVPSNVFSIESLKF